MDWLREAALDMPQLRQVHSVRIVLANLVSALVRDLPAQFGKAFQSRLFQITRYMAGDQMGRR